MRYFALISLFVATQAHSASFLVEAEQFSDPGGWKTDTQFIESMGSPYLNAHGLGKPVTDATTEIDVPEDGEYRVWVRTIDWTKRLGRPESARPSKTTAAMIILGKAEGKVTLATSDFCRETSSFRQVPTFYAAFSLSAFQLYPIPLSSTLRSGQRLFQEPPVKANS